MSFLSFFLEMSQIQLQKHLRIRCIMINLVFCAAWGSKRYDCAVKNKKERDLRYSILQNCNFLLHIVLPSREINLTCMKGKCKKFSFEKIKDYLYWEAMNAFLKQSFNEYDDTQEDIGCARDASAELLIRRLKAWEDMVALAACSYTVQMWPGLLPSSLRVFAAPHCATSFSYSPLLFDFLELVNPGPSLSKRLLAIKYSSLSHQLLPKSFWRRKRGKKWHWIIQGPIRAISGNCLELDEVAQRASLFVCFDVLAPLTPCPSSAVIITGITPLCRGHQMPTFSWLQFPIIAARL